MSRGAGALVVALVAALWFSLTAPYGLELQDEGRILSRSERVAQRGALPNRDFSDVYGPGVSVLNALLLDLFDRRILAIRWSLVAVKTVAAVAVWLSAVEVASLPIAAGATAFAILTLGRASWNLNTPYAALYVLTLGAVALALLLRARARGRPLLAGAAGLVLGVALLFKHSLAAMYAASLGLGIVACMLLEPCRERSRRGHAVLAALFVAILLVPLVAHQVPLGLVRPRDYVLFFAPTHALGILVLLAAQRAAPARGVLGFRALVAAGAGLLAAPAAVVGIYGWFGGLAYAAADLARWPGALVNYAAPVDLPSPSGFAMLAAVVAMAAASLCALCGRFGTAIPFAAVGVLGALPGLLGGGVDAIVARADAWSHGLHALVSYALLAVCAPALYARERPGWVVPAVIVALFHHATGFQIFPRSGFNTLLSLPLLGPSLAVVAAAIWRRLDLQTLPGPRRAVAYACLALPAAVLTVPAVATVVALRRAETEPIPFPETRGLSIRVDAAEQLRDVRRVVDYLKARPDAPVVLFNNDAMILFLSGRRDMFSDLELQFELMAHGMLREGMSRKDARLLITRLQAADDPLVVVKDDPATARLREYLPLVASYLARDFEPAFRAGPYTVLRRRAGRPVTPPGRGPAA